MINADRRIYRSGDTLYVESLGRVSDVGDFLKQTTDAFNKAGYEHLKIDFSRANVFFPNACVPIAAAIGFYRQQGHDVDLINMPRFLRDVHMDDPLEAKSEQDFSAGHIFSKVWKFSNPRQVSRLSDGFADSLAQRVECEKGVVDAISWCLNEIMDNVLQHAKTDEGFIMFQVHPEARNVAVCVSDNGIGIWQSLKDTEYKPHTHVDAITMALKEGITRSKEDHQGNGLWGLNEIVQANQGSLRVKSGKAAVTRLKSGEVRTTPSLPFLNPINPGTIIDFQLSTHTVISLSRALGGHEPVSLRLEKYENFRDEVVVDVSHHSHGTGTRIAAAQLRNLVVNLINETNARIVVSFEGIGIVSSSFADELLGKLVNRFGFYNFQRAIELRAMNETVQAIVHRSVAQRMFEGLKHSPDNLASADD